MGFFDRLEGDFAFLTGRLARAEDDHPYREEPDAHVSRT